MKALALKMVFSQRYNAGGWNVNDQDIIRKGVDLADGWKAYKNYASTLGFTGSYELLAESQYALDALAAQLVRQHLKRHGTSVFSLWYADPMKTIQLVVDNQ